jgi:acid stress chaperone HdeB
MKQICAAVLALPLLATSPASAEMLDLSTITCKDFVAGSKERIGVMLAWMDGYYRDEDDPPILDFDRFNKNAERLGAYCASHPSVGLITAADSLFEKKK